MIDFNYNFEAPAKTRVLSRLGIGIDVQHPDTFMLWCYARHKWFTAEEAYTEPSPRNGAPNSYLGKEFVKGGSSHAPCYSFKAFKSHLRRHHKKLKGCKVTFCHRFVAHNIEVHP